MSAADSTKTLIEARIAEGVRKRRGWSLMSQDEVAAGMRAQGFRWTRSTVAKVEANTRTLTAAELLGLSVVWREVCRP